MPPADRAAASFLAVASSSSILRHSVLYPKHPAATPAATAEAPMAKLGRLAAAEAADVDMARAPMVRAARDAKDSILTPKFCWAPD